MTDNSNDDAYQKGFQDGVGTRGQMVGCAPQQKFLSHPSIACALELKVDQMLGDENFKACALELKEKVLNCVREDGQSNKTLNQEFHRVDQSRDYWLR
ncbi:hypothetical protein WN944_005617 [Citrus x changshan-huyou]|uniref:Uncharacterized protein n=1 Tax=Citrus x changshan-huyou TaxID=2935761 RepID=A0AAP0QJ12_9ROSI